MEDIEMVGAKIREPLLEPAEPPRFLDLELDLRPVGGLQNPRLFVFVVERRATALGIASHQQQPQGPVGHRPGLLLASHLAHRQ